MQIHPNILIKFPSMYFHQTTRETNEMKKTNFEQGKGKQEETENLFHP